MTMDFSLRRFYCCCSLGSSLVFSIYIRPAGSSAVGSVINSGKRGCTALMLDGDLEICSFLLDQGVDPNRTSQVGSTVMVSSGVEFHGILLNTTVLCISSRIMQRPMRSAYPNTLTLVLIISVLLQPGWAKGPNECCWKWARGCILTLSAGGGRPSGW